MKALTCEMCGSTNLIKEDGVFVCQACGTKYTEEASKRMMVEGAVDVKGNTTQKVADLLESAKRAMALEQYENVGNYCKQILLIDPLNWEASFYDAYSKLMDAEIDSLPETVPYIVKSLRSTLKTIKNQVPEEEARSVVMDVSQRIIQTSSRIEESANDFIKHAKTGLMHDDNNKRFPRVVDGLNAISSITLSFGDDIMDIFGYSDLCSEIWKQGIKGLTNSKRDEKQKYIAKIKRIDPDYVSSMSGCYVATAVYGSYDCPEVWTLRRYRDSVLARCYFGRLFIKLYYDISPKLVSVFGDNTRIVSVVRKRLDRFVNHLRANGIESSPYIDINC